MNLRKDIVAHREQRIAKEGPELGSPVPDQRQVPLVPFVSDPLVICEIKRRSPSRGAIDQGLDPVEQAGRYWKAGVRSCSVLTEEDHFSGSLRDLLAVKSAFPQMAVLRKDFLTSLEDVDVSYRAGADAILLIASVLEPSQLVAMAQRAEQLGMASLVEIHTYQELLSVRPLAPPLVGINCRDLETFELDPLVPAVLFQGLDWNPWVVYESGIFSGFQARWAKSLGFRGILVGESVVRVPSLAQDLVAAMGDKEHPLVPRNSNFWTMITRKLFYLSCAPVDHGGEPPEYPGPLVKICGITNREDGELATSLGADVLGFVFAPSPRRTTLEVLRELKDLPVLKVAVVVWGEAEEQAWRQSLNLSSHHFSDQSRNQSPDQTIDLEVIDPEIAQAFREGLLDCIQLHGTETPEFCHNLPVPWYKALRPQVSGTWEQSQTFRSPRVLIDGFDRQAAGGTGKRVNPEIVKEYSRPALWLAGGLDSENIRHVVTEFRPELVDLSSGIESSPGKKDPEKLRAFFAEINKLKRS